jgi:hypothetical protein
MNVEQWIYICRMVQKCHSPGVGVGVGSGVAGSGKEYHKKYSALFTQV